MKILFVSDNCSDEMYKKIERERTIKLLPAQQNFFRLLLKGMLGAGECDIECLSAVPVSASCHPKKKWEYKSEQIGTNFRYIYIPFRNTRCGRHISQFLSTWKLCAKWIKENKSEDKIILCDSIIMQCAGAAKLAAKIHRCKVVGVVTDISKYTTQILGTPKSAVRRLVRKVYDGLSDCAMKGLDGYIFLTEYMNEEINKKKKPYIIIEGIASDEAPGKIQENMAEQGSEMVRDAEGQAYVMYAGGIHEKFGVIKLARAFVNADMGCPLYVYGSGPDTDKLLELEKQSDKVKYKGILSRDEIVRKEREATLLVNPRPSDEDFTRFSFPSKTMEYMASGTPVISTALKGIPEEYKKYIFIFEEETEEGMAKKIQQVLALGDELHIWGDRARQFVLEHKSYKSQGLKALQFLASLI